MEINDDKEDGCGISKWWLTSEKDPLRSACLWHDDSYVAGKPIQQVLTRKEVDKLFLQQMINLSGKSLLLKARAYTYYAIARTFGSKYWEGK